MTAKLPTTMRALELREPDESPVLTEKAVPRPGAGEVLIRVAASPINPNDLLFLRDRYEVRKPRPVVPGFEASGEVVAAGAGLMARLLVGRRVAFAAGDGDGTWAEYALAPAMRCVPLRASVDLDQGATLLTNPLTAWVLARRAQQEGHRAVVLTAAAGALGQMMNRLFARQGQTVINIVRRAAQADALRARSPTPASTQRTSSRRCCGLTAIRAPHAAEGRVAQFVDVHGRHALDCGPRHLEVTAMALLRSAQCAGEAGRQVGVERAWQTRADLREQRRHGNCRFHQPFHGLEQRFTAR